MCVCAEPEKILHKNPASAASTNTQETQQSKSATSTSRYSSPDHTLSDLKKQQLSALAANFLRELSAKKRPTNQNSKIVNDSWTIETNSGTKIIITKKSSKLSDCIALVRIIYQE